MIRTGDVTGEVAGWLAGSGVVAREVLAGGSPLSTDSLSTVRVCSL